MSKKLQNIKNILFDLGEVLIDLDFSKTEQAFLHLLGIPKEQFYSYKSQSTLFDDLETGKISSKKFREAIKQVSQQNISDSQIDRAWNSMLLEFPLPKYNLVQNLRSAYKTFVLSNTNSIHIDFVNQYLLHSLPINNLKDAFDGTYYSHEIKHRKPNKEAFEIVLKKEKIKANETLFIDDKEENIETAIKLGFKTWHLTNREDLYLLANE